MRIVQINENRTGKPVVVKLIKISYSSHLPDVSATPIKNEPGIASVY